MNAVPRLEPYRDGPSRLWVRAQPSARRSELAGPCNGAPQFAVRASAPEGRANEGLLGVLAAAWGLRPSDIDIGSTARDKQALLPLALPQAPDLLLAARPQD